MATQATKDKLNPDAASDDTMRTLGRAMLGRLYGFTDCRASLLDELTASATLRHYGKGEVIGRRNESFDAMGLVLDGAVEVTTTSSDGHRKLMGLLLAGDLFGITSVLDQQGLVNDLWVRSSAVMMFLDGPALRERRQRDPELLRALDLQLGFRYRLLYERLQSDPTVKLPRRVARMLCMLCKLYGVRRGDGAVVKSRLSQTDLADWLGVSRQRLNHAIKQLEGEGLIEVRYAAINVLDLDGLEHYGEADA